MFGIGGDLTFEIAQYEEFGAAGIIIPGLVFLYALLIKNTSGTVKKDSIISVIGIIMFSAGLVLGAGAIPSGPSVMVAIRWFFSPVFLIVGIIVFYFSRLDEALVQYYQAKRICIVHRGVIDGPVFMCSKCNVFYCIPCKEALVKTENKCWNCGAILDPAAELDFRVQASDPIFQIFATIKDELHEETDLATFKILLKIGKVNLDRRKNGTLGEMQKEIDKIIIAGATDLDVEMNGSRNELPLEESEGKPKKRQIISDQGD
ncbi:MAG TPA: hypothetical protein VKM55_05990 [Candidatus Lokiarchaeia archaeon]|nr:hypothetical protein [Candidatus Lokiarchaeia archaeon]